MIDVSNFTESTVFMKNKKIIINALLLITLCGIITITLQNYVGKKTLYEKDREEKRLFLHTAIFNNSLPEGKSWNDYGAGGTNTRIFMVYAVEYLHRWTGAPVLKLYIIMDYIFLYLSLMLLFLYLRKWMEDPYCVIAILYTGISLIATYHYHTFHPWDRISFCIWIVLVWFIREKRDLLFVTLLVLSIPVKFDVIILPLFYLIYHYYADPFARTKVFMKSFFFLILALALYELLKYFYAQPGTGITNVLLIDSLYVLPNRLMMNLDQMSGLGLAYPPFLVFTLPLVFSFYRWQDKNLFMKISVLFALFILAVHFCLINLREVRAQTMVLLLLLPAALAGLKSFFERHTEIQT